MLAPTNIAVLTLFEKRGAKPMIKRMLRNGPLAKATDPRQLLGESQLSASFERLLLDFLTISSFFLLQRISDLVWIVGMYKKGLKDTSYF